MSGHVGLLIGGPVSFFVGIGKDVFFFFNYKAGRGEYLLSQDSNMFHYFQTRIASSKLAWQTEHHLVFLTWEIVSSIVFFHCRASFQMIDGTTCLQLSSE